jgi:hypothetical protein
MSTDEENIDEVRTGDAAGGAATSRLAPGAQAASRARRIGGRQVSNSVARPAADVMAAGVGSLPRWLAWLTAAVTVAAAAILLVFSITASHRVWWGTADQNVTGNRTEVLAAAKSCIARLNSYDYRTLDRAESDALACTTGTFTSQYRQAFETQVKTRATALKAVQTFQVNKAGVKTVSPDGRQWDVLVFAQTSVVGTNVGSTPRTDIYSVLVTMQHVHGSWLIAGYKSVPSA